MRLKLSTFTRAVSQIIFQRVFPVLGDESWERLATACVYLSAKISDSFVDPVQFKKATGYNVAPEVEIRIAKTIGFTFDFPDIHALVQNICKTLGLQEGLKMQKLDQMLSDSRVNSVSFLGGNFDVRDVCMAVLTDEEIRAFEDVYCVEVDHSRVEKVRNALFP